MITRVEKDKKQPNLRYDPETGKYIGFRVDVRSGRRRHRPTFPTEGKARDFIAELRVKRVYERAGIKREVSSDIRISTLFDKRITKIKNFKERQRARRVFDTFTEVVGFDNFVTKIRRADFRKYSNKRIEDGIKPQSADREITILSKVFKDAEEMFPDELENFEPPSIARPKYKKGRSTTREITEHEKDAIIAAILSDRLPREKGNRTEARPIAALLFEISWMFGFRYSEAKYLEKRLFDAEHHRIQVKRGKTQTLTPIDFLPDRAIEILTSPILENDSAYIFHLPCSDHTFAAIIEQACESCGISYGRGILDAITFHSTRHSFITRMVQVADLPTVQAYSGQSDPRMVAHYSHTNDKRKREAMERMYGGNAKKTALELFEKVRNGSVDFDEFYVIFSGR